MTREEAIEILKNPNEMYQGTDGVVGYTFNPNRRNYEAFQLAIKALEQEPCEDCVSRAEVINGLQKICDECDSEFCGDCRIDTEGTSLDSAKEMLKRLPSVTPTHIETVTEFADRCRECGKQKNGKWIFTKTIFDKYGCTVECSSCHKKWKTYDEIRWGKENKFCPNCGIEMESGE